MDKSVLTHLGDFRTEKLEELESEIVEEFRTTRTEQELTVAVVTELAELQTALDQVRTELSTRDRGPSQEELAEKAAEIEAAVEASTEELGKKGVNPFAKDDAADSDDDAEGKDKKKVENAAPDAGDGFDRNHNDNATATEKGQLEGRPEKAEDKLESGISIETADANKQSSANGEGGESRSGPATSPSATGRKNFAAEDGEELSPEGLESKIPATAKRPAVITAGADVPGLTPGSDLPDLNSMAQAFIDRRRVFRGLAPDGDGDQVIVATVHGDYPTERELNADLGTTMDRIDSVTSPEAITASGGLCAPIEPYYGIQVIADAARPVRDALPKFMADRGGVRFQPPPKLTDLANSVGITTATQDAGTYGASEGQTPFKPCLHVTCGSEQSVTVQAINRCLTFGNFAARTYPEQVEAWLALAIAQHSRRAETALLDAIGAASTAVTAASTYSATRSLLPTVDTALAGYRSRNRTSPQTVLRAIFPLWVRELIRADLARGYRGDGSTDVLSVSDAQIEAFFTERNVVVSWYFDSQTAGVSQTFGAQSAGALNAFPSKVIWYLFVEGSFVFLDGGTLDLGLVRDSTLNKTNDYQIFAETFEALAFFGVEALKITSDVCANGSYAPVATAQAPCTS